MLEDWIISGGPTFFPGLISQSGKLQVRCKGGGDTPPPPPPPPKPGNLAKQQNRQTSASPEKRRGRASTILTTGLNSGTDSERIKSILGG